jgi:hypothetical protein
MRGNRSAAEPGNSWGGDLGGGSGGEVDVDGDADPGNRVGVDVGSDMGFGVGREIAAVDTGSLLKAGWCSLQDDSGV